MSENTNNNIVEECAEVKAPRQPFVLSILEFVEMFVIIVLSVLLIFTFGMRLCTVNGASMNQTLYHGETLITTNLFYTPKQDDIIVFHQTGNDTYSLNEPVVKRVIATEGQHVKIDYSVPNTMTIWVDGVKYADTHAYYDPTRSIIFPQYDYEYGDQSFEVTVPEGHLFVMGDNRNNSKDSRSLAIGFVDQRRVIGKCVYKMNSNE